MPVGLQVFNDTGSIQIDQDYINYVVVQTGTVTCTTPFSSGGVTKYLANISAAGRTAPMVALACTDKVAQTYTTVSGSTWTWEVMSLVNGASVNYWVFDVAPPEASTFGLEIYTAAGVLGFHTAQKPLRIAGIGSGTYTVGRTYATIQTACGWSWNESNPGLTAYRYQARYGASEIDANVVAAGFGVGAGILFENYTIFGYGSFTPEFYSPPPAQFIVCDVTNY